MFYLGVEVLVGSSSLAITKNSYAWNRYIFKLPQQSNSYDTTITFQGVLQTCLSTMECTLELDCIHAYLIQTNSTSTGSTSRRLQTSTFSPSRKPSSYPTRIPSVNPSKRPTRMPITYRPSVANLCTSQIDFSGGITSGVVTSSSNCKTVTFPATNNKMSICAYNIQSPLSTSLLWQVGYFNTLYPGGIGLDSCPYHDICPSYMIQLNVSGIKHFDNPRFNMISTPTAAIITNSTYYIYGSNVAGIQGVDMLFSGRILNKFFSLPGVLTYKYLSIVTTARFPVESPGLLVQKLLVDAPCKPSKKPSPVPTVIPTGAPSTITPSRPSYAPTLKPSIKPSVIPSRPTSKPTLVPSAPTQCPTTTELKIFESNSAVSYSSRPVLMHQFQFIGSLPKQISTSCQQYVVDKIQNSTASICNNVAINNGQAIFQSNGPPVSFIQINNIVELSNVNVFSIVTWLTLGATTYDANFPIFSFGDISFPYVPTLSPTYPYEPLGCYTTQTSQLKMTVVSKNSLTDCLNYANTNKFNYFAYGSSFCRFLILYFLLYIIRTSFKSIYF